MEKTTLYLIRHGETEGADDRRYRGVMDVPLSKRGARQMEEFGRRLKAVRFSGIYSSDLRRARQSAQLVGTPQALAPREIPEFRERDFGCWEGLTFEECRTGYPAEFDAWVENPIEFSPKGGESTRDVRDRIVPPLERVLERHRGETFAVVAHGGVNRILLCHFLGLSMDMIFRIEQDFGAVNIVDVWATTPVVKLVNAVFYDGRYGT